ncbi:hypothetical protein BS78_06G074500 [Paspalum vaginatum]|nr:hypothetical protein BS78_06G074500 [Paspalum vaginatum]
MTDQTLTLSSPTPLRLLAVGGALGAAATHPSAETTHPWHEVGDHRPSEQQLHSVSLGRWSWLRIPRLRDDASATQRRRFWAGVSSDHRAPVSR